jgi:hypothetical protein
MSSPNEQVSVADATEADSVAAHFTGNDKARALYDAALTQLRTLGPVTEEAKKTSIHLVRRTALAGVHVRRGYLLLEFKTDYPIDSPLLAKSEQISRNRYHHTLRLESTDQLQGDVLCWLKDAYSLSG